MFDSFNLTTEDSHDLRWIVGAVYKTRAYSNIAAVYDTILGYHEGWVVLVRRCEGKPDRLVQHLTPLYYSQRQLVSQPVTQSQSGDTRDPLCDECCHAPGYHGDFN